MAEPTEEALTLARDWLGANATSLAAAFDVGLIDSYADVEGSLAEMIDLVAVSAASEAGVPTPFDAEPTPAEWSEIAADEDGTCVRCREWLRRGRCPACDPLTAAIAEARARRECIRNGGIDRTHNEPRR